MADITPGVVELANPLLVRSPEPRSNATLWVAAFGRLFVRPGLNLLISAYGVLIMLGPKGIAKTRLLQRVVNVSDLLGLLVPAVFGTNTVRVRLPHCSAELVRGPGITVTDRAIVHFHGGGLVAGGLRTYRRMMSRLSVESGAAVLSVDYRLLIANTFDDAVEDGVNAYRWLLDADFCPSGITVSGDSGGGGLAVAVAAEIKRRGYARPGAIALLSPWVDFDPASKYVHPCASTDPLIPINGSWPLSGGALVAEHLFASGLAEAFAISPLRQDLSALPPTLIHVGGTEVLQADATEFAGVLARYGVPVTLKTWTGQVHLFQLLADLIPEGKQSLAEIGEFVRSKTVGWPV